MRRTYWNASLPQDGLRDESSHAGKRKLLCRNYPHLPAKPARPLSGRKRDTPSKASDNARRGGWTLLQLLMVMSVLMVVSTISVRMLSTLLRQERQAIAHVTHLSTLGRLARQLRTDAHSAKECERLSPPETSRVKLMLKNGHTVRYSIQDKGIARTETEAERLVRQELYRLAGSTLDLEMPQNSGGIVSFSVTMPAVGGSTSVNIPPGNPSPKLRIDAKLGRD